MIDPAIFKEVVNMIVLDDYKVYLEFEGYDIWGIYDFSKLISQKEIYKPLEDYEFFKKIRNEKYGFVWNATLDIASEYVYDNLKKENKSYTIDEIRSLISPVLNKYGIDKAFIADKKSYVKENNDYKVDIIIDMEYQNIDDIKFDLFDIEKDMIKILEKRVTVRRLQHIKRNNYNLDILDSMEKI